MGYITAYRFRVKADWNPRGLWRDIVIGEERSLGSLAGAINLAFGLDFDHLWFFGRNQDFWRSEEMYQRPEEFADLPSGRPMKPGEKVYNAAEVMLGDLGLDKGDRICYLFDYGDEWRFYMILKGKRDDEPSDKEPEVVKEKGEKVDQYGQPSSSHRR